MAKGGSRDRKKLETLRSLTIAEPSREEMAQIDKEISTATDRTAVVLIASSLQAQLRRHLISYLPVKDEEVLSRLTDRDGALSTFFSIIHLSRALGLIDERTTMELEIIRKVRNVFAHAPLPLDFSRKEVRNACRQLRMSIKHITVHDKNLGTIRIQIPDTVGELLDIVGEKHHHLLSIRNVFLLTSVRIVAKLTTDRLALLKRSNRNMKRRIRRTEKRIAILEEKRQTP